MVDIHLYPAKIGGAAGEIRKDTLTQWATQLQSYAAARQLMQDGTSRGYVAGAENNWVGGPGKSGQVQESSKALLQVFVRELDRLIQEKTEFQNSFIAYLDYLTGLANGLQSADNAASATFNSILKKLEGGQ